MYDRKLSLPQLSSSRFYLFSLFFSMHESSKCYLIKYVVRKNLKGHDLRGSELTQYLYLWVYGYMSCLYLRKHQIKQSLMYGQGAGRGTVLLCVTWGQLEGASTQSYIRQSEIYGVRTLKSEELR